MGRLDRFGEPIDDDDVDEPPHDPRCVDGLLGDDPLGRPIPCLTCRPHLIDRLRPRRNP